MDKKMADGDEGVFLLFLSLLGSLIFLLFRFLYTGLFLLIPPVFLLCSHVTVELRSPRFCTLDRRLHAV